MRNQKLREHMKEKGVFYWELAERLGVAESTLYRWMRYPIEENRVIHMAEIVDTIAKEHEQN